MAVEDITRILDMIALYRESIAQLESIAERLPDQAQEIGEIIAGERYIINLYRKELEQCITS